MELPSFVFNAINFILSLLLTSDGSRRKKHWLPQESQKLVKDGFVKREKKQMIPTEDGMKLITVLPDVVKSPKLTADWENARNVAETW